MFSYIKLHIAFCTRYRRKFFDDENLKQRAKELIEAQCEKMNVEILELAINDCYVKMTVLCSPYICPATIVNNIKKFCNIKQLKDEFPVFNSVPSVWTRGCMISTDVLNEDTVLDYVLSQKKRS